MTKRLVAAGVSGFLGPRVVAAATAQGYEVTTLVRRATSAANEVQWNPDSGELPKGILEGADAVLNLCGVGVADKRWNDEYRKLITSSRVNPTKLLASRCIAEGVPSLINASAVGYYGPRGSEIIDEKALVGRTFLAKVCKDWEEAADIAADGGVRVVKLRTGLVLGPEGGLIPKLRTLTKLFVNGRIGSGKQYWPWISVDDWVDATMFLINGTFSGPANLTGPQPVTNAQFTKEIGKILSRPTPWIIPGFAVHAVLGDFAEEVLTGQRAIPAALEDAGFTFSHATVHEALRAELS
ncbi:TIGR01777 family protein [Nakamurella antarctica]|uniref:TIGR01777 family protein n=1 Tax=Nakamurella antarctica TaxID=1902245 RepID=A0A3G8ZNA4_9ACTN|nr:TIGR01777 family oxidoreductase [Nakamurella antarctica]AZI58275.1 TIGR01777 family protein [Nakamurella antarctica]